MEDITGLSFLENLRCLILKEMDTNNWGLAETAIQCDISTRRLSDIVRDKAKDINLSTLIKICDTFHFRLFITGNQTRKCIDKIEKINDKHKQSVYDYINYIYATGKY